MNIKYGIQTPTQSVVLPYEKSEYEEAITIYGESKRQVYPWQENLMKHILAKNEDGLWTHTKIGYSLPRRNGKNEIVIMREIYGLINGEQGLHTAHRTSTSHSAWEKLVRILESAGFVQDKDFTTLKAKGAERVHFIESGGRVDFRTRTTTGGLGEGFDYLIIDEAQEYTVDQESALKYVVTDSKNPQTLMCGTPPTLVSSGTVFLSFRNKTLEGGNKNAMWAEWSVKDESDVNDRDLWYQTNPSLGYHLTERAIEDEVGDDVIDFNIQRLGLWIKYNQKSAISEKDWESIRVNNLPTLKGKLHVGIKYGRDGKNVALSIAVKTLSGRIFVEAIDCQSIRQGNGWIIDFLKNADIENIVIDGASGQKVLLMDMQNHRIRTRTILPKVGEVIEANTLWEQAIFQESICHMNQPSLTEVVTNCQKRNIGSQGGFGYSSIYDDRDIALMDSAIYAVWSCEALKPKRKQRIRY